jgi:plasmid replication initiation protein
MKNYPETQFAKVPNEFLDFHRTRIASELEEKFIALAVVDMQSKHTGLKASGQPSDWDYISRNKITFAMFSEILKVTNNTQHIRKSIQDLKSLNLGIKYRHWNEENQKMHIKTDYISIFRIFTIDETSSTVEFQFEPYFQQFFTDIGKHFQLSIAEIVALNSTHSIRLYSLFKSKLNMDKTKHKITIETLKKYLHIENKYSDYFDFKRRILEVAKTQINASSSAKFQLEYTEVKEGKRVVAIEFEIIPLGEKYYETTRKIPNYKKNIEFKRYQKLTKHINPMIAELASHIVVFAEKYGFDTEQRLLQMYIKNINLELKECDQEIEKQKNTEETNT